MTPTAPPAPTPARPPLAIPTGTMALEEGAGIDFASLRRDRRARVLAEMDRDGIDALLLGRPGNARYAAGTRPLWRAVVTAFVPVCVVVRATERVHLLMTTWDDGVPADIAHEDITGLMWTPATIGAALARVEGLAAATTIGTDGMSPAIAASLREIAPGAALVDGEAAMRRARLLKLPAEVACLRTAVAIAEGALATTIAEVAPGVAEVHLKATFEHEMSRFGTTCPAYEGTFCVTPTEAGGRSWAGVATPPPLRRIPGRATMSVGDLVALDAGVLYAGYEGGVGRTVPCPSASGRPSPAQHRLADRFTRAYALLEAACVPGAEARDLRAAWERSGEPLPPLPLAHGVGLAVEQPVVGGAGGPDQGVDQPLQAGMVLALGGYVWEPGVGGYLGRETVVVTDDGPERLTRLTHRPLGQG
jgi:Xaa-Pro dipeptidase